MPPRRFGNASAKDLFKGHTLKRLLKWMFKTHGFGLVIIAICLLITGVASTVSGIFFQQIIDKVITPAIDARELTSELKNTFINIMTIMISIYVLNLIVNIVYTQIMAVIGQKMLHEIRTDMFKSMEKLPIKYFDTHKHGDIMSYYTNDVDALRQFMTQSLPDLFTSVLSIAFIFGTMLYYSIYLTVVVVLASFVMIKIVKKLGSNSAKYFVAQQKQTAKVEGFIEEMMNGLKVVKVFTHEEKTAQEFDELNNQLCKDATKANYYGNITGPVLNNIGNISYVILAFIGALLAMTSIHNIGLHSLFSLIFTKSWGAYGIVNTGVIVLFLTSFRGFTQRINQASQQVSMCAMAIAGTQRIFDLIDEKPEVDDGYVTLVNACFDENNNLVESNEKTHIWAWKHPHGDGTTTLTLLKGDIVFDDVDFGYNDDKIVLHNISLYAHPGEKIALVGETGAGKTTITNLINRFYNIQDGKVRYDGININKIKKDDLRHSLGIVLQDTNLFTGTVMENIRYGRLDATDEEVYEAAKIANAYDFITRLPEGFNTMLTANGSNLSQGQRQLISIARAAIADAPVMILDEATSSIDTRTELLVQKGTDELMKGRTVFVIAHRLSTVQNSDAIMVLDHGRIIERGNHEQLIAQKGIYYQLYTGAFELE